MKSRFQPILMVAAVIGAALVTPARAEITIKEAEYAGGVLVVIGETTHPNHEVVLDGRYSERSNEFGGFRFRVRYLPDDCTVKLFDGEDRRTAFIRGCATQDAVDLKPPAGSGGAILPRDGARD